MSRGGFRRNAGRPKLSAAHHERRGNYRPAKHGPLPVTAGSNVVTMPTPAAEWQPSAAQREALGAPGRRFVDDWLAQYADLSFADGTLLVEAGHCVDALAALRRVKREGLSLKEHAALHRLELQWSRTLAMLVAQLQRGVQS